MVHTQEGSHIPATYGEFVKVLRKDKTETLQPHRSTNHAIDLESNCNLQYWRIYNLSEFDFRMLHANIEANRANECLQRSS
jgi:hypothetical protein